MDDEIVIVDDDGTEHVFPAGFDPKRAAAIVRGEPTDVFHQDLGTSIGQMAMGGVKELGNIASGIGTMLTQSPIKTLEQATAARRDLLEKAKTAPSLTERIGYEVTGRIPFVGPMLAQIGEQIGTGDPETMGRGLMNIGVLSTASPKVRAGIRHTGSATLSAADKAVRGTQRFIEAHPAAQVAAGGIVGGATGGIPGVILGMAGGRPTAALIKLATKALKTQRGGSEVAARATATPSVAQGMSAAGRGRYGDLAAGDRLTAGMSEAGRAANPNVGGTLVPQTVNEAAATALRELLADKTPSATVGLSHPTGGGFTVPPEMARQLSGVDRGQSLVRTRPSAQPVSPAAAEATAAMKAPGAAPAAGPPAPKPTAQDALRQELAARNIDWRTTDAVPIDAITRDISRPGGSILEAGESRIGLGERLAEALGRAEKAKTPAAAEAALTEARRLAKAARQRMHIAEKQAR